MFKNVYAFPKWMVDDIKTILQEYRTMKETDDYDPKAADKMQQAGFILDAMKRQEGDE